MTIDFNKPSTADNYSTQFVPNITSAFAALGALLDPTYAGTVSNQPTGTKRLNGGLWEQWNGTAWVALSVGYVLKAGDTMSGALIIESGTGETLRMRGTTASPYLSFYNGTTRQGYMQGALAGPITLMNETNTYIDFGVNSATVLRLRAGLAGINADPSAPLHVVNSTGSDEVARFETTGLPYLSFYKSGTRKGYLQFTATDLSLVNESTGVMGFSTNGATILRLAAGRLGVNVTPVAGDPTLRIEGTDGLGLSNGGTYADLSGTYGRLQFDATGGVLTLSANSTLISTTISFRTGSGSGSVQRGSVNGVGNWVFLAPTSGPTLKLFSTVGNALQIDTSVAAQDSIIVLSRASTANGYVGAVGTAGNIISGSAAGDVAFRSESGDLIFSANAGAAKHLRIASTGALFNKDAIELGFRGLPRVTSAIDNGKVLSTSAGFTINTSDLVVGNAYSVYNSGASAITITQGSGVTLQKAGSTTGNVTLAAKGFCTIYCESTSVGVVMGSGVS